MGGGRGRVRANLSPSVGSVLRRDPHKSPSAFPPLWGCGQATGAGAGHLRAPASAQAGAGCSPAASQGPDHFHGECSEHLPARTLVPPPTAATGRFSLAGREDPLGLLEVKSTKAWPPRPRAQELPAVLASGLGHQHLAAPVAAAPDQRTPLRFPHPQVSPGSGRRGGLCLPPTSVRSASSYCKEESDNFPAPSLPQLKADVPK